MVCLCRQNVIIAVYLIIFGIGEFGAFGMGVALLPASAFRDG